jgi:hypothetical protein
MMDAVLSPQALDRASTEELELLDCLRKIGKGLIASGVSVGVVENTLTPAHTAIVSQALAFGFLVPGARGLLSVTSILSEDLQSAAVGIGEMVILILSITLGVLLGTLVVSPLKFVPITADSGQLSKG